MSDDISSGHFHDTGDRFEVTLNHSVDITTEILVRDVEPKPEDLKSLVKLISSVRSEKTSVEFWALYLPNGKINTLAESVSMARKGGAV